VTRDDNVKDINNTIKTIITITTITNIIVTFLLTTGASFDKPPYANNKAFSGSVLSYGALALIALNYMAML
jgi:hypothetical protein